MVDLKSLRFPNKIKLLADARRLEILRLLMAEPATLTQLGLDSKTFSGVDPTPYQGA